MTHCLVEVDQSIEAVAAAMRAHAGSAGVQNAAIRALIKPDRHRRGE